MEVSSHALAMGRVDGTTYDVAVFTNLSEDHLDFHADLEEYFQVKATLFTPARSRLGVVNVDDPHGRPAGRLATVPVVTVSPAGTEPDVRLAGDPTSARADGSTFRLEGPAGLGGRLRDLAGRRLQPGQRGARRWWPGAHRASPRTSPQPGWPPARACPGRMEAGRGRCRRAARPGRLRAQLPTPRAGCWSRLAAWSPTAGGWSVVFGGRGRPGPAQATGDGGDRGRGAPTSWCLTSDNPRSEDPLAIIAGIRRGADEALAAGAACQARAGAGPARGRCGWPRRSPTG
jgi:UDP-N-acetylmuramoyl-L-alanyl-D-glutamate--2,6-diaminopimelate ligase